MKIAIVGGSGFVGTKLIHLLKEQAGVSILNLDKRQSNAFPNITILTDVLDKDSLVKHFKGVDVVVLLAAEHRDDVSPTSLYYEVNVKGMSNVLAAMETNQVKQIIFTSSVAVYGLNKPNPNESAPVAPFNHYGKSKLLAERELEQWFKQDADRSIYVIRPTVIFGEGNRGNVYNLLNQIASGRFMMIGKGNNAKSMSYVENIVAFIAYLIAEGKPGYEVFNYVDKPDLTTNDIVQHTSRIIGRPVPTMHIPYWFGILAGYGFDMLAFFSRRKLNISSVRVKKFCAVTQYDSSKMLASGFQPPYRMEEGLQRMLEKEFLIKS
ncbi:NAD-dependent epimerase/dehydratase family protein [Sphingobacterium ginsenosidimutans]|uniref:NAD-dependent epimerase/dehydratase family protein n=1 Tax=Sphingobacterium ginsenosidimutans TaxID=687845 RepID=A0ABP7ZQU7_9SPHI